MPCSLAARSHAHAGAHTPAPGTTAGAATPSSAHARLTSPHLASRRVLLTLGAGLAALPAAAVVPVPPPPQIGDCPDCAGEVNQTLNACALDTPSCMSTLNDDELHFAAPWQFEATTDDAVAALVAVACGGAYDPGLIAEPFGIRRQDAAAYIVGGVVAVIRNGDLPEQPQRRKRDAADFTPFDGVLADSRTDPDGTRYLRLTLGTDGGRATEVEDPSTVIDAEFLFLPNDSIVNVRAASRVQPEAGGFGSNGQLALSFTQGFVVDKNVARRKMEALRTALRWDLAPVVTDFDPKFNPEAPVWVDKIFKPFDSRVTDFKPSGEAYPVGSGQR